MCVVLLAGGWLLLQLVIVSADFIELSNATYVLDNYFDINNKIITDIFKDYNIKLPALYLSDKNRLEWRPLQINTTLMYVKVLAIDQAKQTASMIIDFYYDWIDPRLKWDPAKYNGIKLISVSKIDTVWLPDALPFDILEFTNTLPDDQQFVNIENNGHVSYYETTVIEFICRLNLKHFPFDTQKCDLKLSSFNFPASEMPIAGYITKDVHSSVSNSSNGEWSLTDVTYEYTEIESFTGNYSIPIFHFTLKRSRTYYIVLMIVPSFILTLLCVIGLFWTRVDQESYMENLNLGFTAILAMMFVLQMATQDMPKINDTDKLSIYLIVNLAIITICSCIVLLMGKSSRAKFKEIETRGKFQRFIMLRMHILFMILFAFISIVNFVILMI